MKTPLTFLLTLLLALALTTGDVASAEKRKLVVITDLEPDDRIALHLLAARYSPEEIAFVGTTVMHAGRKAELTGRVLSQVGLNVPVYQGTGGTAASYPDIASSRAAREYAREGATILEATKLANINAAPHTSNELETQIKKLLEKTSDIEFVMLAPPTDLVRVLEANPALKRNIKQIQIMGGWMPAPRPDGSSARRTTYNWNMDPVASAKLMSMSDIPMTLYSSDMLKASFAGGSISTSNYPRVIKQIDNLKAHLPSLAEGELAGSSWDHHLMERIPPLRNVIGANAGRQFTPADPAVIVGMANDRFITASRTVSVSIDVNDLDPARGFGVAVNDSAQSNIRLVEKVDVKVFENEMLSSFRRLPRLVKIRASASSGCLLPLVKAQSKPSP